MWGKIIHWIEVRIGLEELLNKHSRKFHTPKGATLWSTFGYVALIAFIVQAITGIMLLLYYIPHPEYAFKSVQTITNEIPYGWLFRSIHNVGGNTIIALIIIHLVHVFLRVSYKKPREITWVSGVLMFFLVLLTLISGHLLPWHQIGFWQTTVTSSIPAFLPIIGEGISSYIRGGEFVTGITLSRFFSFHVVILPVFIVALMFLHVMLIRRQGLSNSPVIEPEADTAPPDEFKRDTHLESQPIFPYFTTKRLFMVICYFTVIFFILTFFPNLFLPIEANIQADPMTTPEFIRPEWYFLAPYQLMKIVPNDVLGISMIAIFSVVLLFWPFIDPAESGRNIHKRPLLLSLSLIVLALWVILTIWGMYS
jgi:ubiquinol-cytochrome c reductase cytochrome b subunit